MVILVNKWDLIEKETNTARDMEREIRDKIAPFNDIPIVFISVKEKQRIFKAIEQGVRVFENRTRKIRTSDLNELMQEKIDRVPPPTYRGSYVKIKYVTQLPIYYPAFAFFCNNPKHLRESYKNYLENQLRESYDFSGVPITIHFRKK
jgi:GTP-binding protein